MDPSPVDIEFDRALGDAFGAKIVELCEALGLEEINPKAQHQLKGILKHYAKEKHPFTACVTADTLVDAPRDLERFPDGVRIDSLRKGDLVWSFDEDEREFKLKPVVWVEVTRTYAELVAVTLDNGKTFRCTPDHPVMLRNGRWMDAGKLRCGDSLMPLYRDFEPRVRLRPDRPGYTPEHDVVAEAAYGSVKGLHVHHADRRRANVSIENIEALSNSDHSAAHHRQWEDAVALRNEEWRCASCDEMFTPIAYNQKKCSACQGYQKKVVGKMSSCAVCGDEYKIKSPNQRYCSKICRHRAPHLGISQDGMVGGQTNLATWNHKVVSVEALCEREDVWDIEVMDTHTFVVHGVVLHNCVRDNTKRFGKDRAERICATIKDQIWGTTKWRGKGDKSGEGPHPYAGMSEGARIAGAEDVELDADGYVVISDELADFLTQLSDHDLHNLLGLAQPEDSKE